MNSYLNAIKLSLSKGYLRNIRSAFLGVAFYEIIQILFSPVLTRIYSPADFGNYAFILSVSTTLSILATLRYEKVIIIGENDEESLDAFLLCKYLIGLFSLIFFITINLFFFFSKDWIVNSIYISLLVFMSGYYNILILTKNRKMLFAEVAKVRFIQGILIILLNIFLGFLLNYKDGLIISLIITYVYSCWLLRLQGKNLKFSKDRTLSLIRRHSNFLTYSVFAEFINNLTSKFPFIFFPFFYPIEITGYLSLSYRIVAAPARFISNALSEVFFQKISDLHNKKRSTKKLFYFTSLALLLISICIFSTIFILADYIFVPIFGDQWKNGVVYLKIIMGIFAVSFVVSPLSCVIYTFRQQKVDFILQSFYFLLMVIALFLSHWIFEEFIYCLYVMVAVSVLYYALYYLALVRIISIKDICTEENETMLPLNMVEKK